MMIQGSLYNRANWWLRSVASATNFANVNNNGNANNNNASNTWVGVRPDFGGACKTLADRPAPPRKERLSLRELNNSVQSGAGHIGLPYAVRYVWIS